MKPLSKELEKWCKDHQVDIRRNNCTGDRHLGMFFAAQQSLNELAMHTDPGPEIKQAILKSLYSLKALAEKGIAEVQDL